MPACWEGIHTYSAILATSLALGAFALLTRLGLPRLLAWRGVTMYWHTRFGVALVFDSQDDDGTCVRLLNVGGTYQSVCYTDEDLLWLPVCEYHRTWARAVGDHFAPGAPHASRRALVLGGGGYSFPKWLVAERADFTTTAVEIDPKIYEIARRHFFLDRLVDEFGCERLEPVVADAWEYLKQGDEAFDLIVNDVFVRNRPLGRLSTDEGVRLIRSRLAEGGLYIGNVRCTLTGRGGRVLAETTSGFEGVFDHVRVICERPEEPHLIGNNCLLAWMEDGRGR